MKKFLILMLLSMSATVWAQNPPLNPTAAELKAVAARIYQNETGSRKENLVAWNVGEDFPSLGIGHFIWFKQNAKEPFTESFPGLVQAYLTNGYTRAQLPKVMTTTAYAPWPNRDEFNRLKAAGDPGIIELIDFLFEHQEIQIRYIMQRLEAALPQMMAASSKPDHVREQFYRVATSPNGFYPLIDYVNFKGEGINPNERYKNVGWGLLQVLETMSGTKTGRDALKSFSNASIKVLSTRIGNSPLERGEERWRDGWTNRCRTYA
jgi:hypothetical protein